MDCIELSASCFWVGTQTHKIEVRYENYRLKGSLMLVIGLFGLSIMSPSIQLGTETVNLIRTEGQAKVGGTFVCVCGAIFMVMFRGPVVFGYLENELSIHNEISAKAQPEPAGWLLSIFISLGLDNWHLGVLS